MLVTYIIIMLFIIVLTLLFCISLFTIYNTYFNYTVVNKPNTVLNKNYISYNELYPNIEMDTQLLNESLISNPIFNFVKTIDNKEFDESQEIINNTINESEEENENINNNIDMEFNINDIYDEILNNNTKDLTIIDNNTNGENNIESNEENNTESNQENNTESNEEITKECLQGKHLISEYINKFSD
jgi:hypothetical protein